MTDARNPRRRGRVDTTPPTARRRDDGTSKPRPGRADRPDAGARRSEPSRATRPDAPARRSAPPREARADARVRHTDPPAPAAANRPTSEAARTFERWISNVVPQSTPPAAVAAAPERRDGGDAFGRRPRPARPAENPPRAPEVSENAPPPPTSPESTGFTSFVRDRSSRAPLPVPPRPLPGDAPREGDRRERRDDRARRGPDPRSGRDPRAGRDRGPRDSRGGDRRGPAPRPWSDRAPREGGDRAPRPGGDRAPRQGGDRRPREGGDRRPRNGDGRGPRERGDRVARTGTPRPEGQAGAVNRSRPLYGNAFHFEEGRGLVKGRPADGRRGRDPRGGGPDRGRGRGDFDRGRPSGAPRDDDRDTPALPTNPREAALRILHAADTRAAFSDRMLDGAHQRGGPDPRDLALMHEIVKGTLRWRGRLDWALDQRVHIGLAQTQPWIRNILRLGAYQILFLDRVPAHAAVDESVKLAHKYGHPGTAGLVNSVLRRLVDEKETLAYPEGDDVDTLAIWGSHPRWLVERWRERFGVDDTRALMMANNRTIPSGLRVNALRGTREALIERLAKEGVEATPAALSPDLVWIEGNHSPAALAAFKDGWCTVQDESEALVARLVGPEQHERLLDLCAAPGGKCTHLAELLQDEGEVWALERNEARVASLEATVKRLGTHAVHVVHGDGHTYTFPMPFDRVLVDAPCSGLGVIGRRADARWRKGPEVLREMPPVQLDLLVAGGRRARPGGVLVYSVCSFEPEETTEVVETFLQQNPQFVLESATGTVPDAVVDVDGFMRVLPHVHGCDGAFAARFRKT